MRLHAEVEPAPPLVHAAVRAEPEDAALDHLERRLKPVEHHVRHEGTRLLPSHRHLGRLDQRLPRRQLRPVRQGNRHQLLKRPAGIDQRDLGMVMLQRLHHRPGIEPQHLRQVRARNPPLLPGRDRPLLQVRQHVPRPLHLDLGHQVSAHAGDPVHQVPPALHGIKRPGVHPSILMDREIGVRRFEQDVILRPLHLPVRRVQRLPGQQRLIDRIRRVDRAPRVSPEAGTGVEKVGAGGGHDALVEVGTAAVVPDVVEPHIERRQPQHLRLGQLRLGHPHPRLSRRHHQRTGVRQPERRRQVNGEPKITRSQRRRLERQPGRQRIGANRRTRRRGRRGQGPGQAWRRFLSQTEGGNQPADQSDHNGRPRPRESIHRSFPASWNQPPRNQAINDGDLAESQSSSVKSSRQDCTFFAQHARFAGHTRRALHPVRWAKRSVTHLFPETPVNSAPLPPSRLRRSAGLPRLNA